MAQTIGVARGKFSQSHPIYPVSFSEIETNAYVSQHKGHLHPVQEKDISYFIMPDEKIIIYSGLIKKGFLYPAAEPFVRGYNPSFVEFNPLLENMELGHFLLMDKHLASYLAKLESMLDFKIEIDNDDGEYLNRLSKTVTKYKKKSGHKELFIPLFVYLGEKIKQKVKGIWTVDLIVGMNICYHQVAIMDHTAEKKKKYYPAHLQKALESKYEVDLEWLISANLIGR